MTARRTPLYDRHHAAGARFVEFAGWEMPVSYAGILAEHAAVREAVGVFDVSHMGEVEIRGTDAVGAVNRLITNDLERIHDGQAVYTAMCLPTGGIIDDLVVYRFARDRVLICTNAGNRDKDFAWIREHIGPGAIALDRGDEFVQLAVQGPRAEALLQPLTDHPLKGLRRYWFEVGQVAGIDGVIVARTGYTGEDGFELYVDAAHGPALWDALFASGQGIVSPIGLGARDTLRLEMKYALYGNDIDESTTPLEAGLGWIVKLDKADFIGKDALVAQKAAGIPRRLVAFRMEGKAAPARHGYPIVDADGEPIGHVTSGTRSPTLGHNIGMAYVPAGHDKVGSPLRISIRDKVVDATIVKPPFIKAGA